MEAAKAEIRNPTPDNDPDGVFVNVDIPKAADPVAATPAGETPVHPPVREVGLDPEPVEPPKARTA